ncbi:MAG: hypothetical protein ABIE47_03910 [Pseudomonadota bacterium]
MDWLWFFRSDIFPKKKPCETPAQVGDLPKKVDPHNPDLDELQMKLMRIEGKVKVMSNDYGNTLHEIMKLRQVHDALLGALGVDIVVDFVHIPPNPTMISTRKNGILDKASDYLNAVVVADKLAKLMYKSLEAQLEVLSTISRKK